MSDWTDDRIERLKTLHAKGYSASQIAKDLRQTTRSAVLGKLHRIGLAGRPTASSPRKPKAPPVKRAPGQSAGLNFQTRKFKVMGNTTVVAESKPRPSLSPIPASNDVPGLATSLTLGPHMCKWPIGDPRDEGFTFCGQRRGEGPYCEPHAERARAPYQPKTLRLTPDAKRRRRVA